MLQVLFFATTDNRGSPPTMPTVVGTVTLMFNQLAIGWKIGTFLHVEGPSCAVIGWIGRCRILPGMSASGRSSGSFTEKVMMGAFFYARCN